MAKKYKQRKEIREKGYSLYLPENLSIDDIIKEESSFEDLDKWKMLYLIHLVVYLPAIDKKQRNQSGFVNLSSVNLKSKMLRYKEYLDFMVKKKILICNDSYSNFDNRRRYSKSYKLGAAYIESNIIAVQMPKSKFRTSIVNLYTNDCIRPEVKIQIPFFNKLEVNFDAANKYLKRIETELLLKDPSRLEYFNLRKQEIRINLLRFAVKDISIIIDNTSGRAHSNFTSLKKHFRQFITYNGEALVGVDIRSSQPYILQRILEQNFWVPDLHITKEFVEWLNKLHKRSDFKLEQELTEKADSNSKAEIDEEQIRKEVQEEERKQKVMMYQVKHRIDERWREGIERKGEREAFNMCQNREKADIDKEISSYKAAVNEGDLYEVLLKKAEGLVASDEIAKILWESTLLESKGKIEILDRNSIKLMVMMALYAPKQSFESVTQLARYIFQKEFPLILEFMDNLKHLWMKNEKAKSFHAYNSLAILLQAIESKVMLENVLIRISSEHPSVPVFTIHDCILTTRSNIKVVRTIVEEEFCKAIGHKPGIKIEDYSLGSFDSEKLPYVDDGIEIEFIDLDEML